MRVDENRQHAQSFVVLDEPHAAHIRREIVNLESALGGALAVLEDVQIELEIFDVVENLVPLFERLDINGADFVSLPAKFGN